MIKRNASAGINPVSDPHFSKALSELAVCYKNDAVDEIFYYGSGCINQEVNDRLAKILLTHLEQSIHTEIYDDLIGAARGMCQRLPGIAAILGTGSNIGYYDGINIAEGVKSGGYLLGDEGSGYRIGQTIYRLFSRNRLPQNVAKRIEQKMNVNQSEAIGHLYAKVNPRQYLASYATCISLMDADAQSVVLGDVFTQFVERMILPLYSKYPAPIKICGSVGFHFQSHLNHLLQKFNILAASFERSPLDGLIRYHSNE